MMNEFKVGDRVKFNIGKSTCNNGQVFALYHCKDGDSYGVVSDNGIKYKLYHHELYKDDISMMPKHDFEIGEEVAIISKGTIKSIITGKITNIKYDDRIKDFKYYIGYSNIPYHKHELRKVDDMINYNDSYYALAESSRKGEETMNKEVKELSGNYRVAMVNFLYGTNRDRNYAFALYDDEIDCNFDLFNKEKNDDNLVVCNTVSGYQLAHIVDIMSKKEYDKVAKSRNYTLVTREIVSKVDVTDFKKRVADRERADELKRQMDKMVEDYNALLIYQTIAEKSPEMAKMIEEYKGLLNI